MARIKQVVLWAALSLALGMEVRGELIRGLPCITRFNQLFCRSGGPSYPSERINRFIDDNKALVRRMYGDFIEISDLAQVLRAGRKKRSIDDYDPYPPQTDSYFKKFKHFRPENMEGTFEQLNSTDGSEISGGGPRIEPNPFVNIIRNKRQALTPGPLPKSDRFDACESEEEVATPYWASSSRGKILAIVNTDEFSQIIHQEICTKQLTKRCRRDCGCEQKYKYHRLMAFDPENDCKGIFMEWFLFPSCCSCRCDP